MGSLPNYKHSNSNGHGKTLNLLDYFIPLKLLPLLLRLRKQLSNSHLNPSLNSLDQQLQTNR